jgi:hypothetical protein
MVLQSVFRNIRALRFLAECFVTTGRECVTECHKSVTNRNDSFLNTKARPLNIKVWPSQARQVRINSQAWPQAVAIPPAGRRRFPA